MPATPVPPSTHATAVDRTLPYALPQALEPLPTLLAEFGLQCATVLQAVGLRSLDVLDADTAATYHQLDAVLGESVRRTSCPHVGLLLGSRLSLRSAGLAGRIAANACSVEVALRDLEELLPSQDGGSGFGLQLRGSEALFSYGIEAPGLQNVDQLYDLMLAALCNCLRELCGPDFRPSVVHLPRRRPRDIQPYRHALCTRIGFNAPQAAIAFDAKLLQKQNPGADSLIREILLDRALVDRHPRQPALLAELRRGIRALMDEGSCSRAAAARHVGMHERALLRRLHAHGTTFQAVLDETRRTVALEMLRNTDATVARVAVAVGYRDSTVFTRAFRRWIGVTPREFRASAQRTSGAAAL